MDIAEVSALVESAYVRIKDHILKTPLIPSNALSRLTGGQVYLKLENEQYTGSFKARGSLNKILSLSESDRSKPLITASTGNHGMGFARAVELTAADGTVFLPVSASAAKVKKLSDYRIHLEFYVGNSLQAELHAKRTAREKNAIWISPYNDHEVIAGQGTIALEMIQDLPSIDDVLITVGGGGLISGIGAVLKTKLPDVQIMCCQPEHSMEMTLSLNAGKIVQQEDARETLSDGSAGGIEEGAVTFPIAQQVIDHCITVSEKEIEDALRMMADEHEMVIEGSAAVAVASLIKEKSRFAGRTVVVIICGGNVDPQRVQEILNI